MMGKLKENKISIISHRLLLLLILILISWLQFETSVATRLSLDRSIEPEQEANHNNFRVIFASDANLFHLDRASLLNYKDVPKFYKEDTRDPRTGHFRKASFKFNSSEYLRKFQTLVWYVPTEERTTLHHYDNPKDLEAARGPQFNQELCGLHLKYMVYLLKKHQKNIASSSDRNLFMIMNSFDVPKDGMFSGNNIFPGDYEKCIQSNLLISKQELKEATNEHVANNYFNRPEIKSSPQKSDVGLFWHRYVSPFFRLSSQKYSDFNLDKYHGLAHNEPMRYCFAGVRWPQWSNSTFHKRIFNFRIATCLPDTCDSSSLKYHADMIKILTDHHMSTPYYSGYYIDQLYCLPDESSPLRNPFNYTSFVSFLSFNYFWLLLTIVATITHFYRKPNSYVKQSQGEVNNHSVDSGSKIQIIIDDYLRCWSLIANFRHFFRQNARKLNLIRDKPAEGEKSDSNERKKIEEVQIKNHLNMDPLEGIKVIGAIFVITSHACMLFFGGMVSDYFGSNENLSNSWMSPISTISPSIVDTFFVITGIVTMRTMMSISKRAFKSPWFWFQFILYRYVRIVPFFVLIHWFIQSTFRFLGSGPFWDYGTSYTSWSQVCQIESWWHYIIPSGNFISPAIHCNHSGWYLASDIQFALLTPIIVLLYAYKPSIGHLIVGCSVVAIVSLHINYFFRNLFDPRSTFEWSILIQTFVTDESTSGYVNPLYRCIAYLIGLSAGYILYNYEEGYIREWPETFRKFGKLFLYLFSYQLLILPSVSSILLHRDDNDDTIKLLAAFVHGTLHLMASIGSAIFILLITTGSFKPLARLLGTWIMKLLAKASLPVVLVHIPIIYYSTQSARIRYPATNEMFVLMNASWCIKAFSIGVVVHIVYELPIRRFFLKLMINNLQCQRKQINQMEKGKIQ